VNYSPREEAAREAYKQELMAAGKSNPSTLGTYVGAVSSNSVMTDTLRSVGLLPDDVESLLQLEDPAAIEKILQWWNESGRKRKELQGFKSHINWWIKLRAGGGTAANRSAPSSAPGPKLAAPPYDVRLLDLLQAFFHDMPTYGIAGHYESLLQALSVYRRTFDPNSLKGLTAAFSRLREDILAAMGENRSDIIDDLLTRWPAPELQKRCNRMVDSTMERYGAAILKSAGDTGYSHSLLEALDTLRAAAEKPSAAPCAEAFLELIRIFLLDHDPRHRTVSAKKQDDRFYSSGLLHETINKLYTPVGRTVPEDQLVQYLLSLPAPEEQRGDWTGRMFLLLLSLDPDFKDVPIKPFEEYTKDLALDRLPQSDCPWYPVLYLKKPSVTSENFLQKADLSLRLAEMFLFLPWKQGDTQCRVHRLMTALEALRRSSDILCSQLEEYSSLDARPALYSKLVLCDLMHAKCHLELAKAELSDKTREPCLAGDAAHLYLSPIRNALYNAECMLDNLNEEEKDSQSALFRRLLTDSTSFFSTDNLLYRRSDCEEDQSAYSEELERWKRDFPGVPSFSAPNVHIPIDPDQLRDAGRFETVYSGSFDSVSGKDHAHKCDMELDLFQLTAGGMTAQLQMNQITDNRSMLELLHHPGFRTCCRNGLIVVSAYGDIRHPVEYICANLKKGKDDFIFSSTPLYDDPRSRNLMLLHLTAGSVEPADFPAEQREEAEFLMDSYARLRECFPRAELRRYHQNSAYRFPPYDLSAAVRPLSEVLNQRLEQLMEEAGQPGSDKDHGLLLALNKYAKDLSGLQNRSQYDNAIDLAVKAAKTENNDQEVLRLEKFRRLVYQCYYISNGMRSSRTVMLSELDPDLVLDTDTTAKTRSQRNSLSRLFRQHREQVQIDSGNVSWMDICEKGLIVRRIAASGHAIAASRRARESEYNTGLGYTARGDSIYATTMTPTTSENHTVSISPAAVKNTSLLLEFHGN